MGIGPYQYLLPAFVLLLCSKKYGSMYYQLVDIDHRIILKILE